MLRRQILESSETPLFSIMLVIAQFTKLFGHHKPLYLPVVTRSAVRGLAQAGWKPRRT